MESTIRPAPAFKIERELISRGRKGEDRISEEEPWVAQNRLPRNPTNYWIGKAEDHQAAQYIAMREECSAAVATGSKGSALRSELRGNKERVQSVFQDGGDNLHYWPENRLSILDEFLQRASLHLLDTVIFDDVNGGRSNEQRDYLSGNSDGKKPDKVVPCPRCLSQDTEFCIYKSYIMNQMRHFCKTCQRYWTARRQKNTTGNLQQRENKASQNGSSLQLDSSELSCGLGSPKAKLPLPKLFSGPGSPLRSPGSSSPFGTESVIAMWSPPYSLDQSGHLPFQSFNSCSQGFTTPGTELSPVGSSDTASTLRGQRLICLPAGIGVDKDCSRSPRSEQVQDASTLQREASSDTVSEWAGSTGGSSVRFFNGKWPLGYNLDWDGKHAHPVSQGFAPVPTSYDTTTAGPTPATLTSTPARTWMGSPQWTGAAQQPLPATLGKRKKGRVEGVRHFDASKCGNLVVEAASSKLETYSTPAIDAEEDHWQPMEFDFKVIALSPCVKQYFHDASLSLSFATEDDDEGGVVLSIFSIPKLPSSSIIVDSPVEAARSWRSQRKKTQLLKLLPSECNRFLYPALKAGFTIHQVQATDMMLVQDLLAHVRPEQVEEASFDSSRPHAFCLEEGLLDTWRRLPGSPHHNDVQIADSCADRLEEPGDEPDSESEAMDIPTDEEVLSGESGASVDSHTEIATADSHDPRAKPSRKRSAASAFEKDNLFAQIRSYVNQQIEVALVPLMSALRRREEDEHKHRQKILVFEQEKLALMRQKLECTRRSSA